MIMTTIKLEEYILALNNVNKFHKVVIIIGRFIDHTPSKSVNFHERRAIIPDGMVNTNNYQTGKAIMVLNNMTKFLKILIKNTGLNRPDTMKNGEFLLTKGNKS